MAGNLVTALAIEDATGQFVPLIVPGYRKVNRADGLVGGSVRDRSRPRTGRDGDIDRSRYRNAQPVALAGATRGETPERAWIEYHAISGALNDSAATARRLRYTLGHDLTLDIAVQFKTMDAPLEAGPNLIRWEAVLRASDPRSYSTTWSTALGSPLGSGVSGGLRFPQRFPIIFAPSAGGIAAYANTGTVATPAYIELAGRMLNPIVTVGSSRMVFTGEIPSGGALLIDSSTRTVTLNGANAHNLVDWSQSQWLMLPRGAGAVAIQTTDFDAGAGMTVHWRNAYR